ncbi:sensor histidine kinase [Paenibacillus mucilaginosus]|uniref:histidine kinase n=1 Tax=Paenibacillus mucilaginosus (strain KNP414) TaxID=1036673 RepID=F8FP99_PAEMK|nr:sensor histidine kinase [Paenibacillus mucilaginosus]AEI39049.1 integral membrane sensor signal transduction histidine kinase [Paenibacillus mucilaginosus KNP414]MCG7216181.1 sensor histidine kinase [Paenibacillus mucilaginosus]WDM28086.1 sensor histidine kinase [Paenibacillus mucilaginosus]
MSMRIGQWMDRIQRYGLLRDKPLTLRLFVFSALLVAVPLVLVGLISYQRSADVLESEGRESSLQIIEQVKSHIEYYVRDFEITTLGIVNHPDVTRLLRMRTAEEIQQSGIRPAVVQMLKNASYSRSDISNITLVLDGRQTFDTAGVRSPYPADELRKEYWYADVPFQGTPKLISRVIRWPDGRQEQVFSIVRRLMSPQTLEPAGMLIMDVNFKRIQEISEMVSIGRTGFLYMVDAQNHYVYHPDLSLVGTPAEPGHTGQMTEESGALITGDKPSLFLTYSLSPYLGWRLVTVLPYKELTDGTDYIGRTILWTLIIALTAAYLLGIGFAASLVGPIRRLQAYMRRVEVGDFSVKLEVRSKDEIGLLTHGFNKMVERLESLLEEIYFSRLKETEASLRQKESELKVLQSQLNPHFLYNSLETIRGMALDQDMDDIASMSGALAKLLRYNLKNDRPVVTLREELLFCRMYLRVQQYRFEDRLDSEFDVPDWALELPVVKFALQPIVENSIIHGMEPGAAPMRIRISARRDGDASFLVAVEDTGVGMPVEVLSRIRLDLEQKDVLAGGDHIGVANVHRRIVYVYGEAYGARIDSREGGGTTVTLRFPAEARRQADTDEGLSPLRKAGLPLSSPEQKGGSDSVQRAVGG